MPLPPQTAFRSDSDGLRLVRETPSRIPFGKAAMAYVPFDDWVLERPAAASAALARVLQAIGDGALGRDGVPMVAVENARATLHDDFTASLSDSEALALGLPPATRLALNLRSFGLIHKDGFRIDASWTRTGGVAATVRQSGNRLCYQQQDWRIPEPLWSTLATVEAINAAPDAAARQAGLARLKLTIGEDAADRIRPDGIIERLRLHYASGFSLNLNTSAAGIDFDPVLFAPERLAVSEEGAQLDEAADALLPPALAADFARRFRAGDGGRRSYLLGDGSLLYIDPRLGEALTVVRQAQAGSAEQRRRFASAPQRAIAAALGEAQDDDAAPLFVETQQFSERVAGIDVWRKPVLPWIKPKPNSWLPECFGLRIGDPPATETIEIPPERLEYVAATAQEALRLNEPTFTFDGHVVPATQATVGALASLGDLAAGLRTGVDPAAPPEGLRHRYFLQVRDNLEDVAYEPLATAVPAADADHDAPLEMPATLLTQPKPHQTAGVGWLASCWNARLPGVVLADDMGLGKTWQALAFMAWIRDRQTAQQPVLIVAPTGLLDNWKAEILRHLAPGALGPVISAFGADLARLRGDAGRDIDTGSAALAAEAWSYTGVVLTTYETLRDYHMSFARQPFAAIFYDEAQKLKNPASQLTRAAKTLNARFQVALTGTPVENRLQDLWSIFDVVHPGLLGSSKAFEELYPPEADRLKVLHDMLTEPQGGRPAVLLRRLKEECLGSLPAKHIRQIPVDMPPAQMQAYDLAIAKALVVKGTGERGRMLEVLHMLRGVSLHPVPPDDARDDTRYFESSARVATLFAILEGVVAKREKALVFCETLSMQALLAAEIRRRFALSHPVARIHGGVTGAARQAAVDAFQSRGPGFDVMILSPKAGGVGLTLTAANHVIHLSRWWNPAVEDQATDRCYRIGQEKDVTVYLPQAVHPDPTIRPTSFDLMLHALMEKKRVLSRGLLAPSDELGDASDLFDQVVVEHESRSTPPVTTQDEASPPPETVTAAPVTAAPPAPEKRVLRGKLGLRPKLVVSGESEARTVATPSPPKAPASAQRIVYAEGQARDYSIFTQPLQGESIDSLTIIDPYGAAGNWARRNTIQFAKMLLGQDAKCSSVQLVCYEGGSVATRDYEDPSIQFEDMMTRWQETFPQVPLHFKPEAKAGNRRLHDREITARTRSGRTFVWDLGRGIDGVMTARFECRVNFSEL